MYQTKKICKNCWEEIPKNSKYCPHCHKKSDINYNKISNWSILLIFILIIGILSIFAFKDKITDSFKTLYNKFENISNSNFNNSTVINKISGEKTLTCTKTETDEDGYETTDVMVVTYKNNTVTKVKETNTSKMDSSYVDFTLSFGTLFAEAFNTIDGLNIEYSKISDDTLQYIMEVDYSKINVDDIKEVLGDLYDESENTVYTTNNLALDDFKSNNLVDYTCE